MGCSLDLLKSPQEPAAAWEKSRGQIERKKEGDDDVMDRKKWSEWVREVGSQRTMN